MNLIISDEPIVHSLGSNQINCTFKNYDIHDVISVNKYIEDNSERLRKKYINFIDEIGEKKIGNETIIDFLKLYDDYSFWFSGALREKSIYKQNFSDAIKLMALEEIISTNKYSEISINILNFNLANEIKKLCKAHKINCSRTLKLRLKNILYIKKNSVIFMILRSLNSLIFLAKRKFSHDATINNQKGFLFIAPLTYLNTEVIDGELSFNSNLWDGIPELLEFNEESANFLHIYSPHDQIKNETEASNIINSLNKTNKSNHFLVDSNLPYKVKRNIFMRWLKTCVKFLLKNHDKKIFNLSSSKINFYNLLKDNYLDTIMGPNLIYNLYMYHYSKKFIEFIKNQKKVFYLFENQGWENIFSSMISKVSEKTKFAVPHSTVRFWDLRHFSKIDNNKDEFNIIPNFYLLNSPAAKEKYLSAEIDPSKILECEALRYRHKPKLSNVNKRDSVLIFLDYSIKYTSEIMTFLQNFENKYPGRRKFVFKCHVNCPVELKNYNFKYAKIFDGSIEDALNQHKICFCSNMTSAQVDAYMFGLKIVVFNNSDELNMSPLTDNKDVIFVNTLKAFLNSTSDIDDIEIRPKEFFYSNKKLEKWSTILFDKV